MDYSNKLETFSPTKYFDDMIFRKVDAHVNAFLLTHNGEATFEPTPTTSLKRRKGKASTK